MSFFKLFIHNLKQNLPRLSKRQGLQVRFITVMDVSKISSVDSKSTNLNDENKTCDTIAGKIKENDIVQNKNCTRYKTRILKRQWEETLRKEDGESDDKKPCDVSERIKRKKMVLLLGYCGVDYFGMQRNPGVRTIEEELLKALLEAKYIKEDDFKNMQKAQFQRSSRTDKGVSAARQVVSLKLPLDIDIEEINKRLPETIRVFGVRRVTNKFNSKCKCNARTYSYTLPTYVFESTLTTDEEKKKYRIASEKIELINSVLSVYKGTKNYHNFTEKKYFHDPSASRYMMDFSIEKTFVDSDMEFAVLLVKGQSFMLHQIRKMVGLMIAVVRGLTDIATVDKAFGKEKVMIPTAPGLGLVLDMVHYDRYDARYKDSHESLTWKAEEEAVQKFKHEYIYPVIVKGEIEGNSMSEWLQKLSQHSFEPSEDTGEKIEESNTDIKGCNEQHIETEISTVDSEECGDLEGDIKTIVCNKEMNDHPKTVETENIVAEELDEYKNCIIQKEEV